MDFFQIVIPLMGGLGLFLYGMSIMSAGLEKSAGDKLEKLIEKLSGNILWGVLVGTVVTATIQSSSATTVMTVGFVNAGIMNLTQAIGIIMGANIGTTITAQMLTIDIGQIVPVGIAVGVAIKMFSKNNKSLVYGEIILGLSILFFGMELMKSALSPLKDYEGFTLMISNISKGGIAGTAGGFFIGLLVTAVVQSSSATTGIMLALASSGSLPIEAAFPVLMGTNVGTCMTALISSIGANKTAKRAAFMHLLFNVIGTLVFILLFSNLAMGIVKMISSSPQRQLADAHTLFNVINTALLIPFAPLIVKASTILIPVTEDERQELDHNSVLYLDERILNTPQIAMGQVYKEVMHMAEIVDKSLNLSVKGLMMKDRAKLERVFKIEKSINKLEHKISDYLIKLSNTNVDNTDRMRIDIMFNTVNDLERVGDHAENIAELAIFRLENNVVFSQKAKSEMVQMIEMVTESFKMAVIAMNSGDKDMAQHIIEVEGVVDQMEKDLRKSHISRLNRGVCETKAGVIYLDLLGNLERISDHSSNIALVVLDDI